MLALLKLGCLVLHALALGAVFGWLHGPLATGAEVVAALFLAVHEMELPFFLRVLRAYRGSFASSVVQALLFGVLHSLPLMRTARA